MARPPLRRLLALVVLCAVVAGTVVPAAGSADQGGTQADSCSDDYFDPDLDVDWDRTYTDGIANGSLSDWRGGQLVQVGPDGGCSLAVFDGETAQLTVTTINESRGVVTGTLDLGTNGSLTLTEADRGDAADGNATSVRISNRGPDYSSTLRVAAGNHSQTETLSTGRFFGFAIVRENASTTVKLWDTADETDKQEIRFENTTAGGPLELQLDGRAFLAGLSVGVLEPDRQVTVDTGTPMQPDDDDDNDPFLDGSSGDPPEQDGRFSQEIGSGLLLFCFGPLVYTVARPFARFSEQMDAIGSTTPWEEVEPAKWKVMIFRLIGAGMALAGAAQIVAALF